MASLNISTAPGAVSEDAGQNSVSAAKLELPSIEQVLSNLSDMPSALPPRHSETLAQDEQEKMFRTLKSAIESAYESSPLDLKSLQGALYEADADASRGQRDTESLQSVHSILGKLWSTNSGLLSQAAEVFANGSRDPSWRVPIGQSGVLKFFLDVVSSREQVETDLLLHSLRLIGNSCADTDENREIVVKDNYTLAIFRHFLNPDLIHVAIPVIYNICMDYEPAHSQMAENRAAYIILRLLIDGIIPDNEALLGFAYDLVELSSEQAQGVENSPEGTILLLMELALNDDILFEYYSSLVNSLSIYLEKERFQNVCIVNGMVGKALSVLRRSFTIDYDASTKEDVQSMAQLRLKINTALAEISASSLFAEHYPLDSELSQTLKSWVVASEDQLQICACVMLGNLARSDEVCQTMVKNMKIHEQLIAVLNSDARGAVLHSALGFLKNLAISGDNRSRLAKAEIVPAVSRLWAFDSVPQVQFSAATIARQVIISSMDNISRLLAPLSEDSESPAHQRTYLSLLLSLFEKTDSPPIKTEIGRTVASICRTVSPKARDGDEEASSLLERLYKLHEGVAHPVGAMITQTQWPVVRSEGWFALALMATNKSGCAAVVECLQNDDVMELLKNTMAGKHSVSEEGGEANETQVQRDRDNAFVLLQELLKNESGVLSMGYRETMEDLVKDTAMQHLTG
ncbi:Armadillo-like helical [Penicillium argentinense]|uniref:Armadillo-like helical n=1 Tax=Penicillium argentinense TaxID=1131581 RepID=A0A9W9EYZ7_9EURO|nr:Armadillo-like helical [Penicillium argentinense]KAJ5090441.1 Armadillo-like helical [Penicillium argentinense]